MLLFYGQMAEQSIHSETAAARLMTTRELAAYLGVTSRTIANLIKRRAIPVIRVGSLNRYRPDRVIAALECQGGNRA
jgi:excisionase family DNA binding protein